MGTLSSRIWIRVPARASPPCEWRSIGCRLGEYTTSSDPVTTFDATLVAPGDPTPVTLHLEPTHTGATVARATWTSASSVEVKVGQDAIWMISVPAGSPLAVARDLVVVATFVAT